MAVGGAGGLPGGLPGQDASPADTGGAGGASAFGPGGSSSPAEFVVNGTAGTAPGAGGGGGSAVQGGFADELYSSGGSGADGAVEIAWGYPTIPAMIAYSTATAPAPTNTEGGGGSGVTVFTGGDSGGGCCVISSALAHKQIWSQRDKIDLIEWCETYLHNTWWGETFRRGYQVLGSKIVVPNMKRNDSLWSKYITWAFNNGTKLVRGKKFALISLPSTIIWISGFMIVGVVVSKSYATKCWVSLYKRKSDRDLK